jgi:hypothetical protein
MNRSGVRMYPASLIAEGGGLERFRVVQFFLFALALHEANDMRRKAFVAIRVIVQKENPAYRTAGFSRRPGLEGRH